MDKTLIRKEMIKKRNSMDEKIREEWDKNIFQQIIGSDYYIKASVVFIYVSYNGEVDTHKIINHALSHGKTVCVPRVISKADGMEAVQIKSIEDLISGSYGILEPSREHQAICPKEIDLAIVPGVAFDNSCGRLGYGGGFYDRFLKLMRPEACRAALAYSIQMLDKIPMEPQDEKVNMCFTNL